MRYKKLYKWLVELDTNKLTQKQQDKMFDAIYDAIDDVTDAEDFPRGSVSVETV